jgi:hypothetical protein
MPSVTRPICRATALARRAAVRELTAAFVFIFSILYLEMAITSRYNEMNELLIFQDLRLSAAAEAMWMV